MKSWLFFLLFLGFWSFSTAREVYFLTDPTLTPDGKAIVFSYEGYLLIFGLAGIIVNSLKNQFRAGLSVE